ncbi:PCI domain-containing protein [Mycena indigotica]|uniref:PCI domain-containing protein n=1 Tax=Mycena indigotica TaxID=2126181 RepID=A0A8H6SRW4_9AGAR|nr:PCI domain-containing protein [Mycena indigotica]KAF7303581.1 PCI domain-containing protein [Mycena indigotica]
MARKSRGGGERKFACHSSSPSRFSLTPTTMDLGTNFVAKLEPYLLMAKSAKGAGAAKLIADATSAHGVFVFSELLELPNIQELKTNETHAKSFALLELFAYRTYEDYMKNKDAFPPLNTAQTIKLKHLSIVSLASERRILPYSDLLRALDMPTIRELEDLIIDAIYLDVLRGRLDQKQSQLEVEYTMGRDLAPGAVDSILAALNNWANTTSAVLQTLDDKLMRIAQQTAERKEERAKHQETLEGILREVLKEKHARRGALGAATSNMGYGGDAMDVDEPGMMMSGMGQENRGLKGRKTMQEAAKPVRKRNRF